MVPDEPRPPTPPEYSSVSGRQMLSRKSRALPKRYVNDPPQPPPPADIHRDPAPEPAEPVPADAEIPPPPAPFWYRTDPNADGYYKVYPRRPTHDPDNDVTIDDLCQSSGLLAVEKAPLATQALPTFFPFANQTIAWLMSWF